MHQSSGIEHYCLSRMNVDVSCMGEYLWWDESSRALCYQRLWVDDWNIESIIIGDDRVKKSLLVVCGRCMYERDCNNGGEILLKIIDFNRRNIDLYQ